MSRTVTFTAFAVLLLARVGLAAGNALDPATAKASEDGKTLFYDVRALGVEGQGWTDVKAPFDRFPAKAEAVVRPAVWGLSRHSAGMAVRFVTDATTISARWTVTSPSLAMPHMPATGVSGLDLYVKDEGKWRWAGAGRPSGQTTTGSLASGLPAGRREFMLYLPLYNGVSSVEIGVPKEAAVSKAAARTSKPIVFYGTSVTQGGCASRPGMVHTAIVGRRLHRPVINLGFSGNGTMEPEVAALLAELDPAAYVIEAVPNMSPEQVAERTEPLVRAIRQARPTTPIVLVEDPKWPNAWLNEGRRKRSEACRSALRKGFDALVAAGDRNLTYVSGDGLVGDDGEGTVDGSHPTDLGFVRHADVETPVLEKILGK